MLLGCPGLNRLIASVTIQTRRECRGEADGRWIVPWLVPD